MIKGFESWSELDLVTGVLIGEARGETRQGREGVALTVKTRVEEPCWWGWNWREVVLCDKQFSCWEDQNVNSIIESRHKQDALWLACRQIAIDAYLGNIKDFIGRPTHYHANYVSPSWASKLTKLMQVGRHIFYR